MAVIGAGNVGCALAGDLALRGVEVRLYNRSPQRLETIETAGGISLCGEVEGFAPLGSVTDSLAAAISGAAVVAVTVPTASLPHYASALLEATTPAQLIWLNPGHTGGALYLAERARASGHGERTICQLTTASHVSRLTGPATVRVFLRPRSSVAALPARDVDSCHQRLDALLPGLFGRAESILEADLMNINAVLHPPGMVCNAGWIEATGGDFGFYVAGNGRAVARVIDGIDRERLALAHRLGVPAVPFPELFHRLGFTPDGQPHAHGAYDAIQHSELIRPLRSPPTLDHRYLHEDVGWGLVPWMHLAAAAHSPAPTITSLVHLAEAINGVDYARDGLTLTAMGLADKTPDDIRAQVGAKTAEPAHAHAGL
ncbi:MAG TPA: NAD/NADP octopine/nopaline dehydrogenase family protein [Actinomycetospora sp.]|uniref:NAD/NADP octopine/nopaline dehydrogenase family protein n=1 Tax=Actinomycetospora sp. TaxID=1872135 RepID=UPI002F40AA12